MTELVQHVLSLARGALACAAAFALFYLCGLALSAGERGGRRVPGPDGTPAVTGAAAYVLLCWFGIWRGIPLTTLMAVFAGGTIAAAGLRFRQLAAAARERGLVSRSTTRWLAAFACFYAISYAFLPPSVTGQFLPLTIVANNDVFWYVTDTRYLLDLGRSNVAGFSFLDIPYQQTPAVFPLMAMMSAFFGLDPLSAAMPTLFGCAALTGLLAARIARSAFSLSRAWAVTAGAILVSGPFFRYVAGSYFISTMMAVPVLMHLVWVTVSDRSDRRIFDPRLSLRLLPHYVVLLLLYPVLFYGAIALQVLVIALAEAAALQDAPPWRTRLRSRWRSSARSLAAMAIAFGVVAVVLRVYLTWTMGMVFLGQSQKGSVGWPLDLIPPTSLLGLPGLLHPSAQLSPAVQAASIAAYAVIAAGLVGLYFWVLRKDTTTLERALAGFEACLIGAYVLYFLKIGPSYQQWKFASYFPLPWGFVVIAACERTARALAAPYRTGAQAAARPLGVASAAIVALICVAGNVVVHVRADYPASRWSGALRNLAAIDGMPEVFDVDVEMERYGPTMMAAYFVRTKTLHMVNQNYYPSQPVALDRVSPRRPYLRQDIDCVGIGHDAWAAIDGVGCLMLEPPAVRFDTEYPFRQTYLPIELGGFSGREAEGRWNGQSAVKLVVTADAQAAPVEEPAFVNLDLAPFLPGGVAGQRMRVTWGNARSADMTLTAAGWVSLPVERRDWNGGPRLITLSLSMEFPDAAPPSRFDPASTDDRALAVLFRRISFTRAPLGRVAPADAR